MRYLKFLSALAVSGALLAGCASVAHVEKDDSVNFNKYQSYMWEMHRIQKMILPKQKFLTLWKEKSGRQ